MGGASMIRMKIEQETEGGAKERPGAVPRPACLGEGTEGQRRAAAGGIFVGWVKAPDGTSIPCRCYRAATHRQSCRVARWCLTVSRH
jgi:hypothetical protein